MGSAGWLFVQVFCVWVWVSGWVLVQCVGRRSRIGRSAWTVVGFENERVKRRWLAVLKRMARAKRALGVADSEWTMITSMKPLPRAGRTTEGTKGTGPRCRPSLGRCEINKVWGGYSRVTSRAEAVGPLLALLNSNQTGAVSWGVLRVAQSHQAPGTGFGNRATKARPCRSAAFRHPCPQSLPTTRCLPVQAPRPSTGEIGDGVFLCLLAWGDTRRLIDASNEYQPRSRRGGQRGAPKRSSVIATCTKTPRPREPGTSRRSRYDDKSPKTRGTHTQFGKRDDLSGQPTGKKGLFFAHRHSASVVGA